MAIRFDETDDRVTCTATLPDPTAGITITAWVYISVNTGGPTTFLRLWNAARSTTITCACNSGGVVNPGYFTAGGSAFVAATLSLGTWYRIALTCTGTSATFYIAADVAGPTQVGTGTVAGASAPAGITLGGRDLLDSSEPLNGREAHVRVWSTVLTQSEIEAEWVSTSPVHASGLWANWVLADASDLLDHSGNGHHLSAGPTPVTTEAGPPLGATVELTGVASAASSASGSLGRRRTVSGDSVAAAGATGSLSRARALQGSTSAASGSLGSLSRVVRVSGQSDTASGTSALLRALRPLAGVASAAAGTSGSLQRFAGISGRADTASVGSGALRAVYALRGTSNTASASAGTLSRRRDLFGISSNAANASGILITDSNLVPPLTLGLFVIERRYRLGAIEIERLRVGELLTQ